MVLITSMIATCMHWLLDPIINHYADFEGRAARKTYWMFLLMYLAALVVGAIFISVFAELIGLGELGSGALSLLAILVLLAMIVPTIAITVRRLHDAGFSGWWYLLVLIPYLGGLVVLVLTCLPSQPGSNTYGPHPYATPEPVPPSEPITSNTPPASSTTT
jgi:uncharacterized membrane protein YhaH (DUF805 family)